MLPKPPQTLRRRKTRSPTNTLTVKEPNVNKEYDSSGRDGFNIHSEGRSSCPPDINQLARDQPGSSLMTSKNESSETVLPSNVFIPAKEPDNFTLNNNPFLDSDFELYGEAISVSPSSNPFFDVSSNEGYSMLASENPFLFTPNENLVYSTPMAVLKSEVENNMSKRCLELPSSFDSEQMETNKVTTELSKAVSQLTISLHNAHNKIEELSTRLRFLEEMVNQKL